MKTLHKSFGLLTLVAALTLSACGGNAPEPAPTADAGALFETTPGVPPTVAPTLPPPAVNTGDATAAPAGEAATPTADAAAIEPVADAGAIVGPVNFPDGINPLTGLAFSDPNAANRRPLAIKVAHFPRYVRPQPGLSFADQVYEHYAEGGLTRFTAIFWSQQADQVGPLRSARLIDTILPEMLDSALVTSGGSTGTMRRLYAKPWVDLVISTITGYGECPPLCRESEDTNALFASTAALWAELDGIGAGPPGNLSGLAYQAAPPTTGQAVSELRIEYSIAATTTWRYDAGTGQYLRFAEADESLAEPHLDALTDQQLTADTVVVLFANHVVDFNVLEGEEPGSEYGFFATEIQFWNTGPALIFRDGQALSATWVRFGAGDMPGLVDDANNPVPLKPGQTWFQFVGLTSEVTLGDNTFIRHKSPADRVVIPGLEGTEEAPPDSPDAQPTPEGDATPEG